MTLTNFPNGVSSFGVPLVGGSLPPFGGNYYWCDYVNGSDGNEGTAENPFKTLAYAYTKTRDGRNDVIFIVGGATAASATAYTQRLTATLTWANNATHLIGLGAPTLYANRARISHLTTATTNINPLVNVTGSGCIFANFSLFQGVGQAATAEQLWKDEGQRNYYGRVAFGGMGATGGTTSGSNASSYCLYLSGGGERVFEDCVIGLDTTARNAANASLKIAGAAARDTFRRCDFPMYATAASPFFIDCNSANSLNRKVTFDACRFINESDISGSTPAAVINNHANQNGYVILTNCTAYGATHWTAAAATMVLIDSPTRASMGTTGGFAVNATIT